MRLDSDQHVTDVLVGIDDMQSTGRNERQEHHEIPSALRASREERVLPSECDDSQGSFGRVVVEFDFRIGKKLFEPFALLRHVVERLGYLARRRALAMPSVDPKPNLLHDPLALALAKLEMLSCFAGSPSRSASSSMQYRSTIISRASRLS